MKGTFMKVAIGIISASALCTMPSISFASTVTTNHPTTKHIVLNGTLVSSPVGIAATDPSTKQATAYVPIYYLMTMLNKSFGVTNHWNGTTWAITTGSNQLDSSVAYPTIVAKNQVMIDLNGKAAASSAKIVAKDPASGAYTTYVPIWYVMQVMKHFHLGSSWDGTTWNMLDLSPLEDAVANSSSATNYQVTGNLDEAMKMNLTSQGAKDIGSTPTSNDMKEQATLQEGMVNGEKAVYLTATISDAQDTTQNSTTQIYEQGNQAYENDGDGKGWYVTTQSGANDAINAFDPRSNFNLYDLSNVTKTQNGTSTIFQGGLNATAVQDSITQDLGSTEGMTFQNVKGNVSYTVDTVNGNAYVMNQTVTLTFDSSTKGDVDIQSITFSINANATSGYGNVTIISPPGLPTSSSTTSNTSGSTSNTTSSN